MNLEFLEINNKGSAAYVTKSKTLTYISMLDCLFSRCSSFEKFCTLFCKAEIQ